LRSVTLTPERHLFAHLEAGDRLLGLGDDRLLAGDLHQVVMRRLDLLAVAHGLADTHVQHDLLEPRRHHRVLVAELLDELRLDDLIILRLEAGDVIRFVKHR
jgi:hypothetical protein